RSGVRPIGGAPHADRRRGARRRSPHLVELRVELARSDRCGGRALARGGFSARARRPGENSPPGEPHAAHGFRAMTERASLDLSAVRREYMQELLDESHVAADPLAQFRAWFDEAVQAQLPMVNAMSLATAS